MRPPIIPDTRPPTFWRALVWNETAAEEVPWDPCWCMGPQGDDPYCPCEMRRREVKVVYVEDQPWRTRP
ncbi:hypothetical protein [Phenylobacterium sp.]|jgi:hypothetical protein|uniref:hypothetical protein n=1 Tax=Phenylobacterium sp. TaxID=1871053 RepID=UPI002F419AFC